ncbi:LysR substrate-binding domain-containing protein [Mesorhizobium sp. M0088]|uniref:LysR substrate-binding domain-containing protein n=1 Tax=Mesorhizobium sp. M0088 TaxID=2956873 RepID=UPI00333595B7
MAFPSLHSLRTFESVSRLGSIAAAAAELHVTSGAVSQQLRALQLSLGLDLFEKHGRRLVLTGRGTALQKSVGVAMQQISESIREISADAYSAAAKATLTVSVPSVFGTTWLAARIFRFLDANPDIRMRMRTAVGFEEVDWRESDVAIVYGKPPWTGFWWRILHSIYAAPVCSAQLLRGPNAIREPRDVLKHRLLHEDDGDQWRRWLTEARVPRSVESDIYFDNFAMVLQAARDGHGVALTNDIISFRDLDEGRLVQPLTLSVAASRSYYCICHEEGLANPVIGRFVDWLVDQASRPSG